MEQAPITESAEAVSEEEDWELDIKACRIDGHSIADGEPCEACQ